MEHVTKGVNLWLEQSLAISHMKMCHHYLCVLGDPVGSQNTPEVAVILCDRSYRRLNSPVVDGRMTRFLLRGIVKIDRSNRAAEVKRVARGLNLALPLHLLLLWQRLHVVKIDWRGVASDQLVSGRLLLPPKREAGKDTHFVKVYSIIIFRCLSSFSSRFPVVIHLVVQVHFLRGITHQEPPSVHGACG